VPDRGVPPAEVVVGPAAGLLEQAIVQVVASALMITTFPVLLHEILRLSGRPEKFALGVCAFNWMTLASAALILVATLVFLVLPEALLSHAQMALLIYLLAVEWFVFRASMKIGMLAALGLLAVDVVVTVLISDIPELVAGV